MDRANEGDDNSFGFDDGTVTFYVDGIVTALTLDIYLDTASDNEVEGEGEETFSLTISEPGGKVESQLSIEGPATVCFEAEEENTETSKDIRMI